MLHGSDDSRYFIITESLLLLVSLAHYVYGSSVEMKNGTVLEIIFLGKRMVLEPNWIALSVHDVSRNETWSNALGILFLIYELKCSSDIHLKLTRGATIFTTPGRQEKIMGEYQDSFHKESL